MIENRTLLGADESGHRDRQERREIRSCLLGFGMALILTLLAFAWVHLKSFDRTPLIWATGVLALIQTGVHFYYFLHLGESRKRENLGVLIFSTMVLVIMMGGTIWVMASLAGRMAPSVHGSCSSCEDPGFDRARG